MVKDTSEIKEKILTILKNRGPSLPVHIAKEMELSILFSSAFLSELLSEKKVRMSNMRVGSSPIYFITGQEPLLEKFSQYLKSREKDAFLFLKEKKFLKDSDQEPAIRVALREIKDFAIPFKKNEEIIWRFFIVNEEDFKSEKKLIEEKIIEIPKRNGEKQSKTSEEKSLGIFDKSKKSRKIKTSKRKTTQKENKFFNRVKEFLSENSLELLDIESFSKNEIILRVRKEGREKILFAYNKKRVNDNDIIKSSKKSLEFSLPYIILSLGEPLKKIRELIEAAKNLSSIEKL